MLRNESDAVVVGDQLRLFLLGWDVLSSKFPVPLWSALMTLTRFVTKNAFRNKRRSTLTVLSIAFSLLLLTLMMTIWQAFYLDQGQRRIGAETGGAAPSLSHVYSTRLLSGED